MVDVVGVMPRQTSNRRPTTSFSPRPQNAPPASNLTTYQPTKMEREKTYFEQQREALIGEIAMVCLPLSIDSSRHSS